MVLEGKELLGTYHVYYLQCEYLERDTLCVVLEQNHQNKLKWQLKLKFQFECKC